MFAVIQTGGKQIRVEVGQVVQVERLAGAPGDSIVFDRVLLVDNEGDVKVGSPHLEGAQVKGSLVDQVRGDKIKIYTYKPRQNSNRRRAGHRQDYTQVKIDAIEA